MANGPYNPKANRKAQPAEKAQTYVTPLITVDVVKLVREAHAFQIGKCDDWTTPVSIGCRIDEMLMDAARNGDEIQSFTINVPPETMEELARIERETQQTPDAAICIHPSDRG